MKIAIMQPYFMPYVGYFQLIKAVDKFVFYDDVNFIKQGWINRNNILIQGKSSLFTIPLEKASSFSKINAVFLNERMYSLWKSKFLRTIEQSYKKAPQFNNAFSLLNEILEDESIKDISSLAKISIIKVLEYLKIETTLIDSSTIYSNDDLSSVTRVLDICKKEEATTYINPIGGQELYSKIDFSNNGMDLFFIKTLKIEYNQFENDFIPWLSMLDILMFNTIEETHHLLDQYELV